MNFDLQPHLGDSLIRLRPLRGADFEALYAVASDPLIWEQHPARNRYLKPVFQAFFDAGIASGGALVVEDASTQAVIGSSRYAGYSPVASEVKIVWTFRLRAHWGGAHNAAVKASMLYHAFGAVESVFFTVGENNIRSQKAVLKLGAVLEGSADAGGVSGVRFRLTRKAYNRQGAGTSVYEWPCRWS